MRATAFILFVVVTASMASNVTETLRKKLKNPTCIFGERKCIVGTKNLKECKMGIWTTKSLRNNEGCIGETVVFLNQSLPCNNGDRVCHSLTESKKCVNQAWVIEKVPQNTFCRDRVGKSINLPQKHKKHVGCTEHQEVCKLNNEFKVCVRGEWIHELIPKGKLCLQTAFGIRLELNSTYAKVLKSCSFKQTKCIGKHKYRKCHRGKWISLRVPKHKICIQTKGAYFKSQKNQKRVRRALQNQTNVAKKPKCVHNEQRCNNFSVMATCRYGRWYKKNVPDKYFCYQNQTKTTIQKVSTTCVEDEVRCQNTSMYICKFGRWTIKEIAGSVCSGGKLVPEGIKCNHGLKKCFNSTSFDTCIYGDWTRQKLSNGVVCIQEKETILMAYSLKPGIMGECKGSELQCVQNSNMAQKCVMGKWKNHKIRAGTMCSGGAIVDKKKYNCKHGTIKCGLQNSIEACVHGRWINRIIANETKCVQKGRIATLHQK